MITDFFDNSVGDKTDPASYLKIAEKVRRSVGSMLFITDNPKGNLLSGFEFFVYIFFYFGTEASAAIKAGCKAFIIKRPGNKPRGLEDVRGRIPIITSFEDIQFE